MRITNKARAGIVAGAALAAMAVAGIAGSTLANAADSSTGSSTGTSKMARTASEPLTGATADSVKAAVLAKYPGATVDSMEKETHGTSIYEAHITKADGTKAHVLLDSSFVVTGEHAAPTKGSNGARGEGKGKAGKHGKHGDGHRGGKHGAASSSSMSSTSGANA
jgi:uncharacterized sporulation protein YeaH/YhbH (DUF444 family)